MGLSFLKRLLSLLTMSIVVGITTNAFPADISVSDEQQFSGRLYSATIMIDGPIEVGDYDKIVRELSRIDGYEYGFNDGPTKVKLNSPGGSYPEGLRIGGLLREKGIGTYVADGSICYSACAIIFMHGTVLLDGERYLNRSIHPTARLGFHAPYLVLPDDTVPTRDMVVASYSAALWSVSDLIESVGTVFSEELLMKMLRVPPNDMLLVETYGDLLAWDIALDRATVQPLRRVTHAQILMACKTIYDLEEGRRPQTGLSEAQALVDRGHGPRHIGTNANGDEIYRFSLNDMDSIGCNIGVWRSPEGEIRTRHYGDSYGNEYQDAPVPTNYNWTIGPLYFMAPEARFATP